MKEKTFKFIGSNLFEVENTFEFIVNEKEDIRALMSVDPIKNTI